MIEIGLTVKDKITEFVGVVIGEVKYITGCVQFLVQPVCKKDGIKPSSEWFDDKRLTVLKKKKIVMDEKKDNGPDMAAPMK